ncbi:hypothetical protein [Sphingopyxis sp.]|uniref:hypothetical protein n=1 Tax=Sphingopyxis sp. TaxID=1908224 RepID=UPI003D0FCB52
MSLIAVLLFAGSAATPPQATAVGVARARILSPAEVRRIDGRLDVRVGDSKAPTQLHRTDRRDGGETADFY